MDTVFVEPLDTGWAVRSDVFGNDLVFAKGAHAEDAAKALVLRLAEAGEPVRLKVRLRGGDRVARFIGLPALSADDRAKVIALPIAAPDGGRAQDERRP